MNVLFIGPYRTPSGWGEAARNYIDALRTRENINLTCQPIFMSGGRYPISQEIEKLENTRYYTYDVVIQNVLPQYMEYDSRFGVNVGLIHTECAYWNKTIWPSRINKMDMLLVPSSACVENCKKSGVEIPVENVGIPDDIGKYLNGYDKLPFSTETDGKFVFYFIGEYIERKNVQMLISAYNLEFTRKENVTLILKLNKSGMSPQALGAEVQKDIVAIKDGAKKHTCLEFYPKVIVITAQLTDYYINSLHQHSNCFIMPSAGESWSKPTFDALGFGNTPIVTAGIGPNDYVTKKTGYLIESIENQCMVSDNPLPYLYTGSQTWREPSLFSLRQQMRKAFKQNRTKKIDAAESVVKRYSYENVGQEIERIINAIL